MMYFAMNSEQQAGSVSGNATKAVKPTVSLAAIAFSDGTAVGMLPGDIVVLVGPNNVGKTVALRDIQAQIMARKNHTKVVTAVTTSTQGTADALVKWLGETCSELEHSGERRYSAMGATVFERVAASQWGNQQDGLHDLAPLFVCCLTTEQRLGAASPAARIRQGREPPAHPMHLLEHDDDTEIKFSEYFQTAFGQDLILHRNSGGELPLHCGKRPVPGPGQDRLSLGYQAQVEALPRLNEQGDGMRAFVGVLLHSLVWGYSIVLIDEPEAFLHPPQARMMGQLLAKEVPQDRQLILTTHSGELLRGLLETGSDRVKVVRVTRQGDINPVRHLDSESIRKLWRDPILRHSNVLDGLFYERVAICESDADCRFYAAVANATKEGSPSGYGQQVMFAHCGGKERMPVVAGALSSLGVPLRVVADFDILSAEQPLRGIWEAVGGDWAAICGDWQVVSAAIGQRKPELTVDAVRKQILELLANATAESISQQTAREVARVFRQSSPWQQAKMVGAKYVPSGDATQRYYALLSTLNARGIFPNEEGELESFAKSVGGHGPKWVMEILETRDLLKDPELQTAREFIRKVLG